MKNLTEEALKNLQAVFEREPNYIECYFNLSGDEWLFRKTALYPVTVTREAVLNASSYTAAGKIDDNTEVVNEKQIKEVTNKLKPKGK